MSVEKSLFYIVLLTILQTIWTIYRDRKLIDHQYHMKLREGEILEWQQAAVIRAANLKEAYIEISNLKNQLNEKSKS